MSAIVADLADLLADELIRQYRQNPAWEESEDVIEYLDCERLVKVIHHATDTELSALRAQVAELRGALLELDSHLAFTDGWNACSCVVDPTSINLAGQRARAVLEMSGGVK